MNSAVKRIGRGVRALSTARAMLRSAPPGQTFQGRGESFEPSGSCYDPQSGRILVVNDRNGPDGYGDRTIYAYQVGAKGLRHAADTFDSVLQLPDGVRVKKFEALHRLPLSGDFLVSTAFARDEPDSSRVLRFSFEPGQKLPAQEIQVQKRALARAIHDATGARHFHIEGIAPSTDERHVFFGVRFVGQSHTSRRPIVMLVRCPFDGATIGAPNGVFQFSNHASLGRREGLSDLKLNPDGSYLIVTSHEGASGKDGSKKHGDHGAHAFRIEASEIEGPAPERGEIRRLHRPWAEFGTKVEGAAALPGNTWAFISDEDRDKEMWKRYEPDQGLSVFVADPGGQVERTRKVKASVPVQEA